MLHKVERMKAKATQFFQQVVVNCLSWCVHTQCSSSPAGHCIHPWSPLYIATVLCCVACAVCWAVVMGNIRSLHSASANTWIIGSGFSLLFIVFIVFVYYEMAAKLHGMDSTSQIATYFHSPSIIFSWCNDLFLCIPLHKMILKDVWVSGYGFAFGCTLKIQSSIKCILDQINR